MLLRKRAWDMMHEEFAIIEESTSLAEGILAFRKALRIAPETKAIIVTKKNGSIRGVISLWTMLKAIEDLVLKDEDLSLLEEADWDIIFKRAGTACNSVPIDEIIETDIPILKPTDPMLVVLDIFRKNHRSWALVEEGGKIIGIIMVGDVFRELTRDLI